MALATCPAFQPQTRPGTKLLCIGSCTSGVPRITRRAGARSVRRVPEVNGGQHKHRSSVLVRSYGLPAPGVSPQLKAQIDELVQQHKVLVFMKGTKQFPQCGFSNTVVQVLRSLNVPFETVNILESDALRGGMKEYSQWPTFPQVYIDGEFYGGCDIILDAYQSGELQETLERVQAS